MATEIDDDVLIEDEPEEAAAEPTATEKPEPTDKPAAAEDDGELVITLGDEPEEEDPAKAPDWVRDLRKANREKDRRIRELEQRVAAAAPAPSAVVVGNKPTLESCQFDEAKFENELTAWHDRKRQAEDQQRQADEGRRRQQETWQANVTAYDGAKKALKVADFEEAEAAVIDTFSNVQQGVILQGIRDADTKAKLVYALGKNPKKAKELAAITDPVQFAVAIGEVKTMLKTAPRKSAPLPERTVRGSVAGASAVDSQLERLRADAAKTGDFSKVHQYKQQLRLKPK